MYGNHSKEPSETRFFGVKVRFRVFWGVSVHVGLRVDKISIPASSLDSTRFRIYAHVTRR